MKHALAKIAGGLLYPAVHGYMSAKYLKKMHISQYKGYITLVYARADVVPVVAPVEQVRRMDRKSLGAWFHAEVADLNPNEVIPQLARFQAAAQQALDLARGGAPKDPESVPRIPLPAPVL